MNDGMRATVGHGLCERCRWARVVVTPKGSRFLLCERSLTDPRFPKYPPLPVFACSGFEPASNARQAEEESLNRGE